MVIVTNPKIEELRKKLAEEVELETSSRKRRLSHLVCNLCSVDLALLCEMLNERVHGSKGAFAELIEDD